MSPNATRAFLSLARAFLAFFAAIGCSLNFASAESKTEPESPSLQRIVFHLLPAEDNPEDASPFPEMKLRHATEGRFLPLAVSPGQNVPLERKPARGIKLYAHSVEEQPKGPMPTPLAELDFPASWKTVLVLVAARRNSPDLRLKAFNVGEDVIPVGKIGFINQTGSQIAARLLSGPRGVHGTVEFTLAPGGTSINAAKVRPGDETQSALMTILMADKNGAWNRVANESIGLDIKARTMCLIFQTGPGSVHLVWFSDRQIPPPDPSAGLASKTGA